MNYTSHYSVMLPECMEAMKTGHDSSHQNKFADLTFGGGGHTKEILKLFPMSEIWSTDQDPDALANGHQWISENNIEHRLHLLKMNFNQFPDWAKKNQLMGSFAGIVMDLGVSSHHFDSAERGFSFRSDGPLDMRMNYSDQTAPTAADILNTYSESDLADIFFHYGEERRARKIANRVCERRKEKLFTRTKEFEELVFLSYPPQERHGKTHPATRCFQALRIAVNDELRILENTLPQLLELLAPGGTLAVISFHSLEDRIVKKCFKDLSEKIENPVTILTKKPLIASADELAQNSRSRSAKLRIMQREQLGRVGDGVKKKKNKFKIQE